MSFKRVSSKRLFKRRGGDPNDPVNIGMFQNKRPIYFLEQGFYVSTYSPSIWGVAQIDGNFTSKSWGAGIYGTTFGTYGYDMTSNKLLSYIGVGANFNWYNTELDTTYKTKLPVNEVEFVPRAMPIGTVKLADRFIASRISSPNKALIESCPLDRSAGFTTEWIDDESFPGRRGDAIISRSSEPGVVWVCCFGGTAYMYDVIQKKRVGSSTYNFWGNNPDRDGDYFCPTFVPELGVFVVIRRVDFLYDVIEVFVPEVEPANLSDPVPLQPLEKGSVSTLQVRLTGAQGDPVADYPVDWSLTAGSGYLSDSQTMTDEQGYATVKYIPEDPTSITVQAEIKH